MSTSPEHSHHKRALAVGLGVSGVAAAGGVIAARHYLGRPEDLNHDRAATFRRGAVIMTASALALRAGHSMTFAEISQVTSLNRHNTSWGVNFLLERGLAGRELLRATHEVDYVWATEPLMTAAHDPAAFPLLATHMQLLASQPAAAAPRP